MIYEAARTRRSEFEMSLSNVFENFVFENFVFQNLTLWSKFSSQVFLTPWSKLSNANTYRSYKNEIQLLLSNHNSKPDAGDAH